MLYQFDFDAQNQYVQTLQIHKKDGKDENGAYLNKMDSRIGSGKEINGCQEMDILVKSFLFSDTPDTLKVCMLSKERLAKFFLTHQTHYLQDNYQIF